MTAYLCLPSPPQALSLFFFFFFLPPYHLLGGRVGQFVLLLFLALRGAPLTGHSLSLLGAWLLWPAERGPRQRKDCLSWEAAGLASLHRFQRPRPFRLLHLA